MSRRRDSAIILSGVRHGETTGSPVSIFIPNGERKKWARIMSLTRPQTGEKPGDVISKPRPGHADLAGLLKYGRRDIRDVLERASARETAARVAVGYCARALIGELGVVVGSHVVEIGSIIGNGWYGGVRQSVLAGELELKDADNDPLRCLDRSLSSRAIEEVDTAGREGDTVGGVFEVIALGPPVGLGSYAQWDRRLDARLGAALLSIPGVKGVEIGPAFRNAGMRGSSVHDSIHYIHDNDENRSAGFFRETNRAGGIEGGVSNGEEIVVRAAMKPVPTLRKPLVSVDLNTLEPDLAAVERGDVCAVPAAGVIGEAMVAMVLGDLLLEKFGGDTLRDLKANLENYMKETRKLLGKGRSGRD